jgi:serine/threonine-protein kinase
VFEAREKLSDRRVALKVLHPSLLGSPKARRAFVREMAVLGRIDHANVVRCLACIQEGETLAIALELVRGRSLRRLLAEEGSLGWQRTAEIGAQVASALGAVHELEPSIVHRDLKPENVMVTEAGVAKVVDFGIAKFADPHRGTTLSAGTLLYMSPEQVDGKPVSGTSDLYALGLLLFEMLSGQAPYAGLAPRELMRRKCEGPVPPVPESLRDDVPRGLLRLIERMLDPDPAQRPASARMVAETLEGYLPDRSDQEVVARDSQADLEGDAVHSTELDLEAVPNDATDIGHTVAVLEGRARRVSRRKAATIVAGSMVLGVVFGLLLAAAQDDEDSGDALAGPDVYLNQP